MPPFFSLLLREETDALLTAHYPDPLRDAEEMEAFRRIVRKHRNKWREGTHEMTEADTMVHPLEENQ